MNAKQFDNIQSQYHCKNTVKMKSEFFTCGQEYS